MKLLFATLLATVALAAGQGNQCETHGELLPNPDDCATFWQCAFGHLFLHTCPPGLTYNPPLERCDFPSDDDACPRRRSLRADLVCPPVGSDNLAVQIPNPDDCASFYKCDEFGRPHLWNCPPGLEYNAQLEVCDFPWSAGCSVRKVQH